MWTKADKHLLKDKHISPLVKKYSPCTLRPSKKKDYFRDLVYAIVGQQLSIKAAASIYERLKGELGGEVEPEEIFRKRTTTLRKCGLSFSKIKCIKDLSIKVDRGEIDLKTVNNFSDEEVIEKLTKIKGIGRWTAEMFLMFSLARPDVFPIDDLGIRKGVIKLFGRRLTDRQIGKIARCWKPYRTVASWYIWRGLGN